MNTHHEQLVVLDFDSTLFDVNRFLADFTRVIENECSITRERFNATYELAKKISGSYNGYDHLELLGVSTKEAERIISPAYFKEDYACDGVPEAIENFKKKADLLIWTLGHRRFQEFKRSLIPCLEGIPFLTGEDSKTAFPPEIVLAENCAEYAGARYNKLTLIDDRPKNFLPDPPEYVHQIRIKYPGDRYGGIETPWGVEEVVTLANIEI